MQLTLCTCLKTHEFCAYVQHTLYIDRNIYIALTIYEIIAFTIHEILSCIFSSIFRKALGSKKR